MSQYNSLVALSLLLLSLIIACNGFYQSSYKLSCNKFSRSSSPLMMAGFGKPKENAEKKDNAPSLDSPCPCGSGKQYQNCCQPYHDTALDAVSPVDIIRGRFSSLCAGKGSYLIKTCHPGNKEFVPDDNTLKVGSKKTKRMIWEKEVKAFCDMYEFRGLAFEDEARDSTPAADAVETIVAVTLERKLKSAFKYDFIEEKIKLKRNPTTGVWNVHSSEVKIKPASSDKMVRSSQDNSFIN